MQASRAARSIAASEIGRVPQSEIAANRPWIERDLLVDERDVGSEQRRIDRLALDTVEQDLPRPRHEQPGDDLGDRRFSAARWTDERDPPPRRDDERDIVNGGRARVCYSRRRRRAARARPRGECARRAPRARPVRCRIAHDVLDAPHVAIHLLHVRAQLDERRETAQ